MHMIRYALMNIIIMSFGLTHASEYLLDRSLKGCASAHAAVEAHIKTVHRFGNTNMHKLQRACNDLSSEHLLCAQRMCDLSANLEQYGMTVRQEVIERYLPMLSKKPADAATLPRTKSLAGAPLLCNSGLTMILASLINDIHGCEASRERVVSLLLDCGAEPVLVEKQAKSKNAQFGCHVVPANHVATTKTLLGVVALQRGNHEYAKILLLRTPKEMVCSVLGDTHVLRAALPADLHYLQNHLEVRTLIKNEGVVALYHNAQEQKLLLNDIIALAKQECSLGWRANAGNCSDTLRVIAQAVPFHKEVLRDAQESVKIEHSLFGTTPMKEFCSEAVMILKVSHTQKRCSPCDSCVVL